jgi:hypothetical protein
MTWPEEVIAPQKNALKRMITMEQNIGKLYRKFGDVLPTHRPFWRDMAAEEEDHARALEALYPLLDRGWLLWNIGRFGAKTVEKVEQVRRRRAEAANAPDFTHRKAVLASLEIESSIVDAKFYEVVQSDAPEFSRVAGILLRQTNDHIARIKEESGVVLDKSDHGAAA